MRLLYALFALSVLPLAVHAADCNLQSPFPIVVIDYRGDCQNGLAHGNGRAEVQFPRNAGDEVFYIEGEFRNGHADGKILSTSKSGAYGFSGTVSRWVEQDGNGRYPDGNGTKYLEFHGGRVVARESSRSTPSSSQGNPLAALAGALNQFNQALSGRTQQANPSASSQSNTPLLNAPDTATSPPTPGPGTTSNSSNPLGELLQKAINKKLGQEQQRRETRKQNEEQERQRQAEQQRLQAEQQKHQEATPQVTYSTYGTSPPVGYTTYGSSPPVAYSTYGNTPPPANTTYGTSPPVAYSNYGNVTPAANSTQSTPPTQVLPRSPPSPSIAAVETPPLSASRTTPLPPSAPSQIGTRTQNSSTTPPPSNSTPTPVATSAPVTLPRVNPPIVFPASPPPTTANSTPPIGSNASSQRPIQPILRPQNPSGATNSVASTQEERISTNPLLAYLRYVTGDGRTAEIEFARVSLSGLRANQFPQLMKSAMQPCEDATISIDERITYQVPGMAQDTLGSITLRLQGSLRKIKTCQWEFTGTLKSFDDHYDFNKSTHRGIVKEIETKIGGSFPGKPYDIRIPGERAVYLRGTSTNRSLA